jgi:hypothetical protein
MERERMNDQIIILTKKYIIDFLNALCFSETVFWDGVDQFNEMPIFHSSNEEVERIEQRGAFLVHKKYPWALKVLITLIEGSTQSVCYRIIGIDNQIKISDPKKECIPFELTNIDFSIANTNLGLNRISSYSFADNVNENSVRLFKLLDFLLTAAFVTKEEPSFFEPMLNDIKSFPPIAGDPHYNSVFGVK